MKTITIKLSDFKPYPTNPNTHDDYQIGELAKSLDQFEQVKNIVVWQGHVIAGHGLRQAAMASGITELEAVDVSDWPREKAEKFMIADNRLPELAVIDPEIMGLVLAGFDEIDIPGVDDTWLEDFGIGEQEELIDPGPQIDKAEELREKWGTELGQLWQLGDHRLICGDCTDRGVVDRVMEKDKARLTCTDPPYGVKYGEKLDDTNPTIHRVRVIKNDDLKPDELVKLLREAFALAAESSVPGGSLYAACPAGTLLPIAIAAFEGSGYTFHWQLVWVKDQLVLGRGDYHFRHENVLYGWKHDAAHYFVDDRTQDSVFEIDRPKVSEEHPTMKPIELMERLVRNSSKSGDVVYEPFCGSGSTLIACENLNRRCRAVEIEPKHTAVTLERWHEATGKMPELID